MFDSVILIDEIDEKLISRMLERVAEEPFGRIPVINLTAEEDGACEILEDRNQVKWVGTYPYEYRITLAKARQDAHGKLSETQSTQ